MWILDDNGAKIFRLIRAEIFNGQQSVASHRQTGMDGAREAEFASGIGHKVDRPRTPGSCEAFSRLRRL